MESLIGAGEALSAYINRRVDEIEQLRQEKMDEIITLAGNNATPEQLERVVADISDWENIDFDEKRFVVDKMIAVIRVSSGGVHIKWRI